MNMRWSLVNLSYEVVVKKIIFNYVFEKNLKVVNGRIGTASYTLPYRLMSNNSSTNNGMVELRGIEPRTS